MRSYRKSVALAVFSGLALLTAATIYSNARLRQNHSLHQLDLNGDDRADFLVHDTVTQQDYAFFQLPDGTYRQAPVLYYEGNLVYVFPLAPSTPVIRRIEDVVQDPFY